MSGIEDWLMPHLPQSGRLALDVGANEGAYTGVLADRFEQVHAFEPNPQALPALRATAGGRRNVRLFEAAVTYQCGDLRLNLYRDSAHASAFTDADLDTASRGDAHATMTVPAVALDDLGYQERPVDFIKVDVEGSEAAVLAGATETLETHLPLLLIEVHSLVALDRCEGLIDAAGYRNVTRLPHPHAGVHPGHCWLIARSA